MKGKKKMNRYAPLVFFAMIFIGSGLALAEDWPTYRHDKERSGITSEQLKPPLELVWVYQAKHAPSPAWPDPARHDYHWRRNYNIKPRVIFDRAYEVTAAGKSLYFGSSADDKVYCLDASTGAERWSFFTEGPVRLAPTLANGKIYVGSDDGWVYCLGAKNGKLIWKYKPTTSEHRIPGNERIISLWPVRSSVLIHNGLAVFCAGLFPSQDVYLVTLNAQNGTERSKKKIDVSSQGYLMIKDDKLFTPTGRTDPTPVYSPKEYKMEKSPSAKYEGYSYSLIQAGDVAFAGGDNKVAAFGTSSNKELWTAKVKGGVYSLCAAYGRLFVSTDKGIIYCFSKKTGAEMRVISSANNPFPYPKDGLTAAYCESAKRIVRQTGIRKGYCLDLGCGQGRLAYELAKLTDLKIICVEQDAEKVIAARKALDEAGFYGRVVVHHGTPNKLPYGKYLFNLIVSSETIATGQPQGKAGELFRLLRPCGGVAYIGQPAGAGNKLSSSRIRRWIKDAPTDGWKIKQDKGVWAIVRRGRLPDSGDWTHQYADAGNSACSDDKLIQKPMQLQWFGRPGPHNMLDRHCRPPAPLSVNGRLFIAAEHRLYGLDAYNGTMLWEMEMPELQTRVNIPRDSGYMAADNDYLYVVVKDKCWRLDADTGKLVFSYNVPQSTNRPVKELYDWGYLAVKDGIILGSGVRKGSFFTDAKGPWYDGHSPLIDWENAKVCSDYLFAVGKEDGKEKWKYEGLIINSAIAAGDDRIYFVENRNPKISEDINFFLRRIGVDELWQNLHLVALDAGTGRKEWEKPLDLVKGTIVFYLCYSDETLLVVSSPFTSYTLYAFDAADGSLLWEKESSYRADRNTFDHSGHMQHPVIMDDVVYQDPHDFNLKTGVQGSLVLTRDGHGCGTLSGAAGYLFGRGGNPRMYDLSEKGKSIRLTHVTRPGCWINMIPAGGLLLIPEASSGCSCPFPVQTSMAFVSK